METPSQPEGKQELTEESLCKVIQQGRTKDPGFSPCFSPLAEPHQLLGYLTSINVEDLHPLDARGLSRKNCFVGNEVCVLIANEHVARAFKKLTDLGFHSAPVLSEGSKGQRYIGHVDMGDFVHHLMQIFREKQEEGEELSLADWLAGIDGMDQADIRARWNATVMDVLQASFQRRHFTVTSIEGLSVLSAMEILGKLKRERVAVISTTGRVVSIVTASMMISLLRDLSSMEAVAELLQVKVRKLSLQHPFEPAETVQGTQVAAEAFERMVNQQVPCLAVLNSAGHLVDVLSMTDLKLIGYGAERLRLLGKTVFEFKTLIRSRQRQAKVKDDEKEEDAGMGPDNRRGRHGHGFAFSQAALYVTPANNLLEVVNLMSEGRIHNIFICTEDSAASGSLVPIGVIHQTDVLAAVLRRCGVRPRQNTGEPLFAE